MQFKNIIAQQSAKDFLIKSIGNKRISHAQLFIGPAGNGAMALAIAYAQMIHCENPSENDSCGVCSSCIKVSKLIHPDLHFSFPFFATKSSAVSSEFLPQWREAMLSHPYLDFETWKEYLNGENKQAGINIAEAHDIIKKLGLKPFESEYKVLILWLPEYLDQRANALLKLIEEPPLKTVFLFVTENTDLILPTILSRMQMVKIPAYSTDTIEKALISKKGISEDKAKQIALMADGNLHQAFLLTSSTESNFYSLLVSWLRTIVTDRGLEFIKFCEEDFYKLGRENQKSFILYALKIVRQVLFAKHGLNEKISLNSQETDFVNRFSELYSDRQLELMAELLEKTYYNIERNANAKILFLDLSLQLVLIFKFQTFPFGTQHI